MASQASKQSMEPVPNCDWRTFIRASDDATQELRDELTEYFRHFVQPPIVEEDGKKSIGDQTCVGCGEPLTGFIGALLGKGGFTWGIAHGEGHCRKCGWPARGHHFINAEITLRNFILQYHPDFVERKKPVADLFEDIRSDIRKIMES